MSFANKLAIGLAAITVAAAVGTTASAAVINVTSSADTYVRFGINQGNNHGTALTMDIFQNAAIRANYGYVRFDLSAIPAGSTINSVSVTFTKTATPGLGQQRNDTLNAGRFAAYGLNDFAGNTAQNWDELTLTYNNAGSEDIATSGVQFDTVNAVTDFDGTNGNEVVTAAAATISGTTGQALANFVAARINALTDRALTTFIIDIPNAEAGRGYGIDTREGAVPPRLIVDYTEPVIVPEPAGLTALAILPALLRRRRA
jgi:hypothetical protein